MAKKKAAKKATTKKAPKATTKTKTPLAKKGKGAAPKKKDAEAKRLSALDAAAQVLAGSKEPMTCKEMIEAMATKGLWSSPAGRTPHATLYSAIAREITNKGAEARFKKAARGRFARNS